MGDSAKHHVSIASCTVLLTAVAGSAHAQLQWTPGTPEIRAQHTLTYDSARGEVVLVGGFAAESQTPPTGTFVYNGVDWVRVAYGDPPAGAINAHSRPMSCFDSLRSRLVLGCGGDNAPALWEWDGASWSSQPAGLPGGNQAGAMAFDAARGVTVRYGPADGLNADYPDGTIREWNGTSWSSFIPTGGGLDLDHRDNGYSMVFDSTRNVVIIAGWQYSTPRTFLTWTWDGANAALVSTSGPPLRKGFAMAYDAARDRTVLFGGFGGWNDTWEWDGTAWTQQAPAAPLPAARFDHQMCYDSSRQRVVMYGGQAGIWPAFAATGDTWEWDGTSWTLTAASSPPPLQSVAMAFDPVNQNAVVFGGFDAQGRRHGETWTLDGSGWALRATTGPAARYSAALAWDSARNTLVLFGGAVGVGNTLSGETWLWNGSAWSPGPSGPSPRATALAFDPDRGVTVLFGGYDGSAYTGDTWTFDGTSWTLAATSGPTVRGGHAMAWDPISHRVILFGGTGTPIRMNDTWAWDGSSWTQLVIAGPSARFGHMMCTDGDNSRVLLFGGNASADRMNDLWTFDGTGWSPLSPAGPPPAIREECGFAYDTTRHAAVLHGFIGGDTWLLSSSPAAIVSNPQDTSAAPGQDAELSVDVEGTTPFTFQWLKDGVVLADGVGVEGSRSARLQLHGVSQADAATYTIRVRDTFGNTRTASADLALSCPADFNGDGFLDFFDADAFILCFEGVECPPGRDADYNGDGFVDFFDADAFVVEFEAGC